VFQFQDFIDEEIAAIGCNPHVGGMFQYEVSAKRPNPLHQQQSGSKGRYPQLGKAGPAQFPFFQIPDDAAAQQQTA
jgi:hypothetical protein